MSTRLRRRLPRITGVELAALSVLAVLSAVPLAWLGRSASTQGLVWVGIDAAAVPDALQYVAWVREAGEHVLISNRFVADPTNAVFLHPGLVISGALTWLGVAPPVAYLVWKPVAVVALFLAARAYMYRLVSGSTGRAVGLVLALLYLSPAFLLPTRVISGPGSGDLIVSSLSIWPVYPLWGYLYSALAVALMPAALLAYERARNGGRTLLAACLLGLACSWLRPWQGMTVIIIILAAELLLAAGRRGSAAGDGAAADRPSRRALAATLVALTAPLAYYFVLSRTDPSWETAQNELGNQLIEPNWWTVAIAIAPLAIPAALAYRRAPRDFQHLAVRVWPFASLALLWVVAEGGVGVFAPHALQGLSIPLAVLAVSGVSSLRHGPVEVRWRIAAWVAVALLIVPSTVDALDRLFRDIDSKRHPYFLDPSERRAFSYLDEDEHEGAVLAEPRLGPFVPMLTGRHTAFGHVSWTPGFFSVEGIYQRVFDGYLGPEGTRTFVRQARVAFILTGCTDAVGLTEALRPILHSVRRFGCATVYSLGGPRPEGSPELSTLSRRGDREIIELSDGTVRVVRAPRDGIGAVEVLTVDDGKIAVAGWALDRSNERPDYILAFAGDRPLASGISTVDRPDVVRAHQDVPLQSGFHLYSALPPPPAPGRPLRVRAFAVSDGEAIEVPFLRGVSPLLED